jgi:HEAT repeat protein
MLKGMKGALASLCLMGLLVLGLCMVLTLDGYAQDEDLEVRFQDGVNLYNRGQLDDALKTFQAILAENPSHELAFKFWNKAGHQVFLQMLLERGEFENVAKRFIELAGTGRKEKQEDAERIQELVSQVVGGDQRERTEALMALMADHGEFSVEHMYNELASDDLEARINVMTGLVRIGEEGVLPLIEVLHADDAMIRRNAAAVLGNIGDSRALAALKAMMENDEDGLNKDVASESLEKILEKDAAGLPASSDLYLDLAKGYLNRDESVLKPYFSSRVVWKWRDGQLTKTPVHPGLLNLELAEEACYQALRYEPGSSKALTYLAFTYAAQKAEVDAARMAAGDDPESLPEALVDAALKLQSANRLVAMTGPDALNEALEFALQGGHSLPAVNLIWILSRAGTRTPALETALKAESKLVQYAAAIGLANMGVHTPDVVRTLVSALQESAVRNVLVVDDQSNTRNVLVSELNKAGYFAVGAENGALGLMRVKAYPKKDLVILRVGLGDITTDKVVYEMASGDTADVPIMLLVEEANLEEVKGIWEGKVTGFIGSPTNSGILIPAVQAAMGEAMNEEREQAMSVSGEAAKTLSAINTELLTQHQNALITALDKSDDVKIQVLNVLSNLGDRAALEKVKEIFGNEGAPTEVRVAAANTLGAIFAKMDGAPDGDVLELLVNALGNEEPALSSAAGAALGKARNLPEGLLETALVDYRID